MAGRYTVDRARLYDELEDALAAFDVAKEALDMARQAVHRALEAAEYPHLREERVTATKEATLSEPSVA